MIYLSQLSGPVYLTSPKFHFLDEKNGTTQRPRELECDAVKAFNKNRLQHSIYFHSEQFEKNPDWCMLHLINVLCDFDRSPNLFSMHMCEN